MFFRIEFISLLILSWFMRCVGGYHKKEYKDYKVKIKLDLSEGYKPIYIFLTALFVRIIPVDDYFSWKNSISVSMKDFILGTGVLFIFYFVFNFLFYNEEWQTLEIIPINKKKEKKHKKA